MINYSQNQIIIILSQPSKSIRVAGRASTAGTKRRDSDVSVSAVRLAIIHRTTTVTLCPLIIN